MPVEGEGRIRFVRLQDLLDRYARRSQLGERTFLEDRRKTRGEQQRILVAQRNPQVLGEAQDHVAARLRSSGLEVREMPRRAVRGKCEVRLRHASAGPPAAEQDPEWNSLSGHAPEDIVCRDKAP